MKESASDEIDDMLGWPRFLLLNASPQRMKKMPRSNMESERSSTC